MDRFQDKVVLVTGAASGLGAEAARQFAAEGASLVLVDRDDATLRQTADAIAASGAAVEVAVGDVSQVEVAAGAVERATRRFARLDVLFANAGIDPLGARSVTETTEAQWDAIMSVNVKGAFLFARAALPVMERQGAGAIVCTASVAGLKPGGQETAYNVSKAALVSLTQSIAIDYAARGVRANCICPGFLESVMTDRRRDLSTDRLADRSKSAARLVPLGREGRYAEIARSVLFLAHADEAAYITGVALAIDGGLILK